MININYSVRLKVVYFLLIITVQCTLYSVHLQYMYQALVIQKTCCTAGMLRVASTLRHTPGAVQSGVLLTEKTGSHSPEYHTQYR